LANLSDDFRNLFTRLIFTRKNEDIFCNRDYIAASNTKLTGSGKEQISYVLFCSILADCRAESHVNLSTLFQERRIQDCEILLMDTVAITGPKLIKDPRHGIFQKHF
jgi:predicted secreted protein